MSHGEKHPSHTKRVRRSIQTAEGYLELMSTFEAGLSMDVELAQPLAERMLRLLDGVSPAPDYQSYVLHLKGEACRFAERFDEATAYFRRSLEIEPDSIHGLLAIAWCFKRSNRLHDAIEAMQVAIEFSPDQAICHYNLACYFALAGRVSNAIEYLAHALELQPTLSHEVASESDFDAIRHDPEFVEFLSPVR